MGQPDGKDSSTQAPRERRASVRFPVEMWVEDISDGSIVHRRAGNLSDGGLFLDHTIPMPLGSSIRLRFILPEQTEALMVTGTIVSVQATQALGMGVKFVDVDPSTHAKIVAFLQQQRR